MESEAAVTGLRARFERTVTLDGKEVEAGMGILERAGPDLYRLHVLAPREQLVVHDGRSLWTYTPAENLVEHVDLESLSAEERRTFGGEFVLGGGGFLSELAGYRLSRLPDRDGMPVLEALPQAASAGFRVLLKVDPGLWRVVAFELVPVEGASREDKSEPQPEPLPLSQTLYEDFRGEPGKPVVAHRVVSRMLVGEPAEGVHIVEETWQYTRVEVNAQSAPGTFEFHVPEGVRVVDRTPAPQSAAEGQGFQSGSKYLR